MYEFKLEQFEGPLDLLLHLIDKAKIDIKDIFISKITSQYIEYIEQNKSNMDETSEFLTMAATLLYIKSKRMLPEKKIEENEDDIEQQLILQLEEYNKFKNISEQIKLDIENAHHVYTKFKDDCSFIDQKIDLNNITVNQLCNAFSKLMQKIKDDTELPQKTSATVMRKDKYTIYEKMDIIMTIVSNKIQVYFEDLFEYDEQGDMIITFLSLLELISNGKVGVFQQETFGKIQVKAI